MAARRSDKRTSPARSLHVLYSEAKDLAAECEIDCESLASLLPLPNVAVEWFSLVMFRMLEVRSISPGHVRFSPFLPFIIHNPSLHYVTSAVKQRR